MKIILIENCNECVYSRIGDSISEMTCIKLPMYEDRVDRFSIPKNCPLEDAPVCLSEKQGNSL